MQTRHFPTACFSALQNISVSIVSDDRETILRTIDAALSSPVFSSKGWQANLTKLRSVVSSGVPVYSIFAMDGNGKLPFVSFSSLPGVTCPGAGECLKFCYSFRAWRYPASFMRQAQNAFLMRFNRDAITNALSGIVAKMPQGFDMRLYVDGDFSSVSDVTYWFELLNQNPTIRAYGYSKSFDAILAYAGAWPTNYQLNISGGHNANDATVNRVKVLPITRGEFIAVSIGRKINSKDHGTPSVNRALRETFKIKAFTCPGKCGSCTGKGHACGMSSLKGLPIIIAMH
jgi:hypothetical protein